MRTAACQGVDWNAAMTQQRQKKDAFFKEHERSPLPPKERPGFAGLRYFALDPTYRKQVPLVKEEQRTLDVPRTSGDVVAYTRVGYFDLDLPIGKVRLAAYSTPDHGDQLFVPFRDATSGKQTYGAGRYMEAFPIGGGRFEVDLNRAYFPFCAYNEAYACPLPPAENWLQVPILVGERSGAPPKGS